MVNDTYKKRPGTAGVEGQLYESKVLSLLNFRALHDDDIEEFYLATNVDLIGEFDDICLRVKVKGFAKQMAVFAQTKHRKADRVLSLSFERDLKTCFQSYLTIRRAFGTKTEDKLIEGTFSETECLFIMYTNAKYDFNNELVETEHIIKLKKLMGTNEKASYFQPRYETKEMEKFVKVIIEEQIVALAEHFAIRLGQTIRKDELMWRYYYILGQKVFEISDIINGHRNASFRKDFFDSNEHFVLIFKNSLYKQVLLRQKLNEKDIEERLKKFFSRSTEVEGLSEVIGTVVVYKNGKLEFIKTHSCITEESKQKLNQVSVDQSIVEKSIVQAAKSMLENTTFKVPYWFGNTDLTIRGNKDIVESRLVQLCSIIVGLINNAKPSTSITIEESLGNRDLEELASAVGNVFVSDENFKHMKFANNIESIKGDLAKRFYQKLQQQINDLTQYTIKVKVLKFPKLSFDSGEHEAKFVKDFLKKLIFFTDQSNQQEIDEILKQEMREQPYDDKHRSQLMADAVFLKYHEAIQKWWMDTAERAEYLTKHSKHFENAKNHITNQSVIYTIDSLYDYASQNVKYTLNATAVRAFKCMLDKQCKTNSNVIATDNCKFTVNKLREYLNNKKTVVLDIELILKLANMEFTTLCTELATNKETVILVNYGKWCEKCINIVVATKPRLFIVTKSKNKIDARPLDATNLIDLSDESRQTFLENTKVIFQGEEVSLGLFVKDEKARKLIKGDFFHEMIENKIFKIGMPLGEQNYDKFKDFYIDRRVSRSRTAEDDAFPEDKDKLIQTLYDLQDHVILLTAIPGMGKSTLLTHLSIKTKKNYPNTWIVRINLVEYSTIFSEWQKDKIVIDHELSLYFMCFVAQIRKEEKNVYVKWDKGTKMMMMCYVARGDAEEITAELQIENNLVSLKHCSGDASITFGFEMFLHFYNSGTLIFLFDGFDEIFPHYKNEALSLVKSVRSYPRQHKIWITSRSYNDIKDVLEQELGRSYELAGLSKVEQVTYLKKIWKIYYGVNLPTSISDHGWQCFRVKLPDIVTNFYNTPLHLYILAKYLCADPYIQSFHCRRNELNIYEMYVDTKLDKIFCEEKRKVERAIPANDLTWRNERAEILSKHKKLAAYAIFYSDVDLLFNGNELREVRKIIEMLKLGTEKSGFIHRVVGIDIPLFAHRLIAEYFALGYLEDLLRSDITYETRNTIERLRNLLMGDSYLERLYLISLNFSLP